MSTLRTDFSGSFDAGLFAKTETYGTVTQTGGEMIFTGDPVGAGICYVTDQTAVDISSGDDFCIQMSGTTAAWPVRMWIAVLDSAGRGWGIRFGGTGVNAYQIGTFTSGLGSWSASMNYGDYDIAVHVFMRVRYASGTAYWDYSTDGSSFTNRASATVPSGFDPTTAKGLFGQVESDANGIYKVTNYYAPALAGGGGSTLVTKVPQVFGAAARQREEEELDFIRSTLGSFQLSGIGNQMLPIKPTVSFGYAQRQADEDDSDAIRAQLGRTRIRPAVRSANVSIAPRFKQAKVFGLQARLLADEEEMVNRAQIARIFANPTSSSISGPAASSGSNQNLMFWWFRRRKRG